MIPILYDSTATTFTSNGLGRLTDCISCLVTEERNGGFEVEFEYPIDGIHYKDIVEGRIITVDHDEVGDAQPFEIYAHTAPLNGVVTFNAHHISYRLSNVILKPMTASSASATFTKFESEVLTDQPFTFWTDVTKVGTFKLPYPASVRSMMGGTEGSVLDVYGGEYEYDNYTVKLHAQRGADNGVEIRYGKNLSELNQEYDTLDLYSAIIPYWIDDQTGDIVYGKAITGRGGIEHTGVWEDDALHQMTDENSNVFTFKYFQTRTVAMDFSDQFEAKPTAEELEAKAASYLAANKPWVPKEDIEVDFVALWQTEEYAAIAPLERVQLCDTVRIIYTDLGVDAKAKVIKTVWNALTEKYDKIELGEASASFADTIMAATELKMADRPTISMMDEAISHATEMIRGGSGGHVVIGVDADGQPNEIFVMDTDDVNTAVQVLRININGIGFSSNGIDGEYRTAWTLDGNFVADFITAGTLNGNRVRTGVIASTDGSSSWDLDGSTLRFYDSAFDSYVELDEGSIRFGHGNAQFGKILRMLSGGKDILAITGPDNNTRITMRNYIQQSAEEQIYINAGRYISHKAGEYIYQNADTYIYQKAGSYMYNQAGGSYTIEAGGSVSIDAEANVTVNAGENNSSHFNIYDNTNYQYADINSGGDTWERIDGKNGYITISAESSASWLRVDGNNGYIWLKTDDLIINGFSGATGSFTAGDSTITVKNGIITNIS